MSNQSTGRRTDRAHAHATDERQCRMKVVRVLGESCFHINGSALQRFGVRRCSTTLFQQMDSAFRARLLLTN